MYRIRTLALSLALTLTAACGSENSTVEPKIETTTFASSLGVDLSAMTKSSSGLYTRDLTVGTGAVAVAGKRVGVHYVGSLANGTQFDANGPTDAPFSFTLGAGQVIAGWDEGVAGMKVGGRRQLVIPPSLGYGSQANGPIPGNSILVFTVDLVSVQ